MKKIISVFFSLLVAVALVPAAQAAKGGGGGSRPAPAAPAPRPVAPAKPPAATPALPPRSIAPEPLLSAALAGLRIEASSVTLPPPPPGTTEIDENGKSHPRSDYDWQNLRVVNGRYWLVGAKTLLISEPGSAARWPVVKRADGLGNDFADGFSLRGATYLLGRDWLAEVSPDGTQMLRVVHLTPGVLVFSNMSSYFVKDGKGKSRNLPAEFTRADTWRNLARIINTSGWSWSFGRFLDDSGRLDYSVRVGESDVWFEFFQSPEGESRLRWTVDGKKWSTRAVNYRPKFAEVAAGRNRLVAVDYGRFKLSTDGAEWTPAGSWLPEVSFQLKLADGKVEPRSESGRWEAITYANGIFAAVGRTYRAGARYDVPLAPDAPVLGLSFDGHEWRTFPLPPVKGREWLITGADGKFVLTHRKYSGEVIEVTVAGLPALNQ